MKKLLFIILFSSSLFAQNKIILESGVSGSDIGFSVNCSSQLFYPNSKNLIAGIGINIMAIMNYNGLKKPDGLDLYFKPQYLDFTGIEERGPYGLGAGLRLISNFGLAIEGGILATSYFKYSMYDFYGLKLRYAWTDNNIKFTYYGRLLTFAAENKFSLGIGFNNIEKTNLYVGYKF
jgi:hypothetical protein